MRLVRALTAALVFLLPCALHAQQTAPDILLGCQYNATPPALSSGQTVPWQCDSSGRLLTGPATVTINTTPISGGTTGKVLYDNAGTVGEYAISGSGSVCMTTSCVMTTPSIGAATAASVAVALADNTTAITVSGSSITGSNTTPIGLSISGTANTSGVIDGAILFANITNTASGSGSLAIDIKTDATTIFSVALASGQIVGGTYLGSGDIRAGAAQEFYWVNRSSILSPSDGVILLQNQANNNFTRLQFGGTSASFPSVKRNATALNFRLADDSADAPITSSTVTVGSSSAFTLGSGEVGLAKISATGSAPGAGALKFSAVAGTNAGTCKIIAYAGTSTTPVTIVDNVGGSC